MDVFDDDFGERTRRERLHHFEQQIERVSSIRRYVTLGFLLVLLATGGASLVLFISTYSQREASRAADGQAVIASQIASLKIQQTNLDKRIGPGTTAQTPSHNESPSPQELKSLEEAQKILAARVNTLEAGISSNPERFLSVPMLRKDLDAETKLVELMAADARRERDQILSTMLWAAGILITLVIAAMGIIIPLLWRTKESSPQHQPPQEIKQRIKA